MVHIALDENFQVRHLSSDCTKHNETLADSANKLSAVTCLSVVSFIRAQLEGAQQPTVPIRRILTHEYFNRFNKALFETVFVRSTDIRQERFYAKKVNKPEEILSWPITKINEDMRDKRKALVFNEYLNRHVSPWIANEFLVRKRQIVTQCFVTGKQETTNIGPYTIGVMDREKTKFHYVALAEPLTDRFILCDGWFKEARDTGAFITKNYCRVCQKEIVNVKRHIKAKIHQQNVLQAVRTAMNALNNHAGVRKMLKNGK